MYFFLLLGESGPFPEHYPSGCLLGCVDVEDCLPQTEYKEKVSNFIKKKWKFTLICSIRV